MMMTARVRRLEQKAGAADPFAAMSEADLVAAIAGLDEAIAAATGMAPARYAEHLDKALRSGDVLPDGLSKHEARCFVLSLKASNSVNAGILECAA
jgi:hypothetical protein